jgi:hypothetical protein
VAEVPHDRPPTARDAIGTFWRAVRAGRCGAGATISRESATAAARVDERGGRDLRAADDVFECIGIERPLPRDRRGDESRRA